MKWCGNMNDVIIQLVKENNILKNHTDRQQSKLERVEHLHQEYWKQQDKQTPNDTLKELMDRTKKILDDD